MNNDRNRKIEEVLGSLDGIQKAAMPDFFYTRLEACMEKRQEPGTKQSWILRPAFALAALAVVLLINAVVILRGNAGKSDTTDDSETLQSIAAEYSLNDNNAVYDLNQNK
jgi:hypothetical protein